MGDGSGTQERTGRNEMNPPNRRRFLLLIAAGLAAGVNGCAIAGAGGPSRGVPTIGYLSTGSPTDPTQGSYKAAFLQGLNELGYIEGQTIIIEWRYADARTDPTDNLNAMAADLVARKVQVIVTSSTPAVVAAAGATRSIPIVSGGPSRGLSDLGLVESDARPGGNVTGTGGNTEVYGKRIELLREALPHVRRIAILWYAANPGMVSENHDMLAAASQAGLIAQSYGLQSPADLNNALTSIQRDGAQALVILPSSPGDLHTIISFAANARLPILGSYRDQAVAGALLIFAPAYLDLRRRAAAYVDKILRGAKPGDLPVEQAQRFDVIVNLATARTMGLTVPDAVLLQATEVLQ